MAQRILSPFRRRTQERLQEQGLRLLESEARARPHDERILLELAEAYRAAGNPRLAIRTYWQATQLFSTTCSYSKALRVLHCALELEPEALFLRRAAAQTLERLDRPKDAAIAYRIAAEIARHEGRADEASHLDHRGDLLDTPSAHAPRSGIRKPQLPISRTCAVDRFPRSARTTRVAAPTGADAAAPAPSLDTPLPSILLEPERPATFSRAPEPPARSQVLLAAAETNVFGAEEVLPGARRLDDGDDAVPARPAAVETKGTHPDDVVYDGLSRDEQLHAHSKELLLDAESILLARDPAEAATAHCSPQEIRQIKTRTLISQAEHELQSILTFDETIEEVMFDLEGSYA